MNDKSLICCRKIASKDSVLSAISKQSCARALISAKLNSAPNKEIGVTIKLNVGIAIRLAKPDNEELD